jgi:hypothetical protein
MYTCWSMIEELHGMKLNYITTTEITYTLTKIDKRNDILQKKCK